MGSSPLARRLRVRAFAKINLSLQVLGIRPDGYHDLRTRFQTIALHDTLTFLRTEGPFEILCSDSRCPRDRTNLVWRAAELVWRAAGRGGAPTGVQVRLVKRIPIEAGLGGGSSDAAVALRAFAAIWRVPLRRSRLTELARKLGADVPFFLEGGTALGVGRGDRLRRLPDAPASWVVLLLPDFGVSTKEAYAWWDRSVTKLRLKPTRQTTHLGRRSFVTSCAAAGAAAPETASKCHDQGLRSCLGNDLQAPVAERYPEIADVTAALYEAGASHAAMSGSGSAVFGLFKTRREAERAALSLTAWSWRTVVTRTLDRQSVETGGRPDVSSARINRTRDGRASLRQPAVARIHVGRNLPRKEPIV